MNLEPYSKNFSLLKIYFFIFVSAVDLVCRCPIHRLRTSVLQQTTAFLCKLLRKLKPLHFVQCHFAQTPAVRRICLLFFFLTFLNIQTVLPLGEKTNKSSPTGTRQKPVALKSTHCTYTPRQSARKAAMTTGERERTRQFVHELKTFSAFR